VKWKDEKYKRKLLLPPEVGGSEEQRQEDGTQAQQLQVGSQKDGSRGWGHWSSASV